MRGLTPDRVEMAILDEEAKIAQARARQMALIGVADAMQLPTADGARSMREWLAGRLDVSTGTANRLSATARRMQDHPGLSKELAAGEISFDRAEAESRVPADKADRSLRGLDIQGVRRVAARHRRMSAADDHRSHVGQDLTLQPNLDESEWHIWGKLDGYSGAVVDKRLTEEADEVGGLPDGTRPGLGYRKAVALTRICEGSGQSESRTPLMTVFIDEHGAVVEGGVPVGPAILDQVACTGSLEVIKSEEGRPLAMGRKTRVISPPLRRFVLHRDGGCTADGCTSRYRLQVHHKTPWSQGGRTDPESLTTLCWFHHHVVVHGWGYRIDDRLGPGRIRFIPPGKPTPGPDPP